MALLSPQEQRRMLPEELIEAPTTGLFLQEARLRVLALYDGGADLRGYEPEAPFKSEEGTLQALKLTVAKVAARLFEAKSSGGNLRRDERGERTRVYFSETTEEITFSDCTLLRPFDESDTLYSLP